MLGRDTAIEMPYPVFVQPSLPHTNGTKVLVLMTKVLSRSGRESEGGDR
ncbi:hypothetical protein [Amycolatopsis sp. NBC_00438]